MSDDLEGLSSALLRLGELLRDSDPETAQEHLEQALLYTQLRAQSRTGAKQSTFDTLDDRKLRRLTQDLASLQVGQSVKESHSPTSPSIATTAQSSPMLEHNNSPMALSAKAWWSMPGGGP